MESIEQAASQSETGSKLVQKAVQDLDELASQLNSIVNEHHLKEGILLISKLI